MNTPAMQGPRGSVIILCAVFMLSCAAFNGQRIDLVLSAISAGWRPAELTAYLVLFPVTQFAVGVPVGRLVDKISVASALATAMSVGLASALSPLMINGAAGLITSAILANLSSLIATVSCQHAIGELSTPMTRLKNFNLFSLMGPIGNGIASLIVGMLWDARGENWGTVPAALACVIGLAVVEVLLRARQADREGSNGTPGPTQALSATAGSLSPRLRSAMFGSGILFGSIGAFCFFAPLIALNSGFSSTAAGEIILAYSMGSIASRLLFMHQLSNFSEDWLAASSFALSTIALTLFIATGNFAAFALSASLFGAAAGVAMPTTTAICHAEAPKGRSGALFGMLSSVRKSFEILALLVPLMFAKSDPRVSLALFALGSMLAASVTVIARPRGTKVKHKPENG